MIVGTAGHIDHGKTTLVRALTGVDTDRLKDEKARGISIDLGFAYLAGPDGAVLGFVDVPGHEKFIHNMLAGATGIDVALLVIAADDGVMPQTREHLAIVDLLGIRRGVVALTKIDRVAPARHGDVAAEIAQVLQGTGLAGAPIVPISAVTGEGIATLRDRLFAAAAATQERVAGGRFRLAIDRSFTLAGTGTVVTGTVLSGAVSVGDRVTISPAGLIARVRSIHAQNRPAERGMAGQRCALNLAGDGITKDAVKRGQVVLDPDLHAPTVRIDAELRLLADATKPVTQWTPVRLHHAAAEVGAHIVLLHDAPIAPGGEALVQLALDKPIAAAAGDRFVLRDAAAQRTIGGGRFANLRAPTRKRRAVERLAQLRAHAVADPQAALAALLETPPHVVDLDAFARDRALGAAHIDALGERLGIIKLSADDTILAVLPAVWLAVERGILAALQTFHAENPDLPGIALDRLRVQLDLRVPPAAVAAALQALARRSTIALDGAWVRLAGHTARLVSADEKAWGRIEPLVGGAERFRPPRVRDIATALALREGDVRRLLKLLGRMGQVDEIAHDHFFLRATTAEMVGIAASLSADGRDFSAAEFRDRMQNGRKVAIQILEFFDRHGVTLRRGDQRRISAQRLELFGALPAAKPAARAATDTGLRRAPAAAQAR
jgi:selenocysteine-specific elongation factor